MGMETGVVREKSMMVGGTMMIGGMQERRIVRWRLWGRRDPPGQESMLGDTRDRDVALVSRGVALVSRGVAMVGRKKPPKVNPEV